jgi:DNA polymerase-3 subunit gamma/tau
VAFYQKYRSKTFHELIGQDHVANTLLESIKGDRLVHAYLLTGPRGIGKTSTARLLAKSINCLMLNQARAKKAEVSGEPCNECVQCLEIAEGKSLDVVEIDAASHTGVDDVRDLIEKARLAPAKSLKKVYIIDEVHMLSKSAFNALLKTLEEPPSHVIFILATTEAHKIPATISLGFRGLISVVLPRMK